MQVSQCRSPNTIFIVKDVKDLADTIRKAFVIAKSGRPAPVLIDIPKDVTANKTEYQKKEIQPVVPSENVCEEDIENAVKMIQKSKKPYVFIGGGAVLSRCKVKKSEHLLRR